ncbi:hypothetical protein BO71DRAFT_370585 [Aspergillus ellipticus CBS 707.79]|uniref:Zn(2)-C6 fungal-type domain-containing protein n=1 Tax=Aspergillus ellipticus CBS 707.79 TaxID=1448320 RepID=A0A319E596_9EURO|nr:hypothetical protein BO71DRAFT_370585 [Aspergillus ellipticus CBS 707.79]
MSQKNFLRDLLPRGVQSSALRPKTDFTTKRRRNASLACTECQKKRAKCSGTMPCTRCITKECECIYDPTSDRRSKAYISELLNSQAALCRIVSMIRSGAYDEISCLLWEIQNQKTDQEAITYLIQDGR